MIFYAVEDLLSEAVIRRLILEAAGGHTKISRLGARLGGGASTIRSSLGKYSNLANRSPVILVTDLDQAECAPTLKRAWFGPEADASWPKKLVFCVAVREIEAWLLADRDGLSGLIGVSRDKIGRFDEMVLRDPKGPLIDLVRQSRSRDLKADLVPKPGVRAKIGPGYNATLSNFATRDWQPLRAAEASPSLARAVCRIRALAMGSAY